MRPAGELREAVKKAAEELAAEKGAATWRELAEHARAGYMATRRTVDNMLRSGELERVGTAATGRRPAVTVAPAKAAATKEHAGDLQVAMSGWASI